MRERGMITKSIMNPGTKATKFEMLANGSNDVMLPTCRKKLSPYANKTRITSHWNKIRNPMPM